MEVGLFGPRGPHVLVNKKDVETAAVFAWELALHHYQVWMDITAVAKWKKFKTVHLCIAQKTVSVRSSSFYQCSLSRQHKITQAIDVEWWISPGIFARLNNAVVHLILFLLSLNRRKRVVPLGTVDWMLCKLWCGSHVTTQNMFEACYWKWWSLLWNYQRNTQLWTETLYL